MILEIIFYYLDSEIESGDEDEVHSSDDSDSSSGEESVSCPICLLKFKGQAIGFPEVCGHPFCLDCILEWTKVLNENLYFFYSKIIMYRKYFSPAECANLPK